MTAHRFNSRWSQQILVLFTAAFLAMTAACGGAGSSSSSTAPPDNPIAVAPTITVQPQSQMVTVGQAAIFSVTAGGTAPLACQWMKRGAALGGASNSHSYTTPPATTADDGSTYSVAVSNSAGQVASDVVALTVTTTPVAPSITTQPQPQNVAAGQTATFNVVAMGTAPLSYQWNMGTATISGATSSTYTTHATSANDDGSTFTVTVSNGAGHVTSNPAMLTVTVAAVSVSISPGSPVSLQPNGTVTFTATVSGTTNTVVNWSVQEGANGGSVDGSGHYTAPATEGTYHVIATSAADPTKAATATVVVSTPSAGTNICNETVPADHYVDGIPAYAIQCSDTIGEAIYSDDGIETNTTGGPGWVRTQWNHAGSGFSGYQCTEFARRYMYFKWGVTGMLNDNLNTNAQDWCGATLPSGLVKTDTPVHGDVIVFAGGSCGATDGIGHVAVIDVVDSANQQLTIVDENGLHRGDVSMSCASCYLHATANDGSGN